MSLRDKYKKRVVKIKDYKRKAEQDEKYIYSGSGSDWIDFEDGKSTKLRLFPAHDGSPDFMKLRKKYFITVDGDDGEPKRTTVLDSVVHGGTKKDIIQAYIDYVVKNRSKDKRKLITNWKTGLLPSIDWVAYAVKIDKDERKFGLVGLKKTVRDEINKAIFLESDDEPIEIDPFTDPDDGLPIIVKYKSKPNKKRGEDYYTVSVGRRPIPLTDEELEKHDESPSLSELYDNVYTMVDFETALNGLEKYDLENEIDAWDDDEWLEIVEEIRNQYDEIDEDEDDDEIDDDQDDIDDDRYDDEDEDDEPEPTKRRERNVRKKSQPKEDKIDDIIDDEDDEDDEDGEPEPPKRKKRSLEDIKKRLAERKRKK